MDTNVKPKTYIIPKMWYMCTKKRLSLEYSIYLSTK